MKKFNCILISVMLFLLLLIMACQRKVIPIEINTTPVVEYLRITSTGEIMIGSVVDKQVSINIDRFNELTENSEWKLLNAYLRNYCYITLWKNKVDGEEIECIGTYPPQTRLNIQSVSPVIIK